jgi:hypothetical protein
MGAWDGGPLSRLDRSQALIGSQMVMIMIIIDPTQALSGSIKLYGGDVGGGWGDGDANPDAGDAGGDGSWGGFGGALGRRAAPDLLPFLRRADADRLQRGFDDLRAALRAALKPEASGGVAPAEAPTEAEADELVALVAVLVEQARRRGVWLRSVELARGGRATQPRAANSKNSVADDATYCPSPAPPCLTEPFRPSLVLLFFFSLSLHHCPLIFTAPHGRATSLHLATPRAAGPWSAGIKRRSMQPPLLPP